MTIDDIRNIMANYSSLKLSPAVLNRAHVSLEMPKKMRDDLYKEMKKDPDVRPSSFPFPLTVGTVTVMVFQGSSYKRTKLMISFDVTDHGTN